MLLILEGFIFCILMLSPESAISNPLNKTYSNKTKFNTDTNYDSLNQLNNQQMDTLSGETLNFEVEKLKSEIARNKAEEKKFTSESKEIESRIKESQKFDWNWALKFIIPMVGAMLLFTVWMITNLRPILLRNQELAEIVNRINSAKNEEQAQLNVEARRELDILRISSDKKLLNLKVQNDNLIELQTSTIAINNDLSTNLKRITEEYQALANKYTANETEKTKYLNLAKDATLQLDRLTKQFAILTAEQEVSVNRGVAISDDLISSYLIENNWIFRIPIHDFLIYYSFRRDGNVYSWEGKNEDFKWKVENGILTIKDPEGLLTYTIDISKRQPTYQGNAWYAVGGNVKFNMEKS